MLKVHYSIQGWQVQKKICEYIFADIPDVLIPLESQSVDFQGRVISNFNK